MCVRYIMFTVSHPQSCDDIKNGKLCNFTSAKGDDFQVILLFSLLLLSFAPSSDGTLSRNCLIVYEMKSRMFSLALAQKYLIHNQEQARNFSARHKNESNN
jgi:hypothetical protein